jgi:hypothetical protein
MDQLTRRLLRLLQAYHGWRRAVLVVQEADGMVGWLKLPDDLELTLRLNTDATVSLTLGHRDAGEAFLAELATLVGEAEAGSKNFVRNADFGLDEGSAAM